MAEILRNVFLGDAVISQDVDWIKSNRIRAVLTFDVVPISPELQAELQDVEFCFFKCADLESENISQYFSSAFKKIDSFLEADGRVLVHCVSGVSRSSTVVVGYLCSRKHCSSVQTALDLITAMQNSRAGPMPCPNDGFVRQLHRMFPPTDQTTAEVCPFKCTKCGVTLFDSTSLVHLVDEDGDSLSCKDIFTEAWLPEQTDEASGKMYCPGCKQKCGTYNWAGQPCASCHRWIVPAFHWQHQKIAQKRKVVPPSSSLTATDLKRNIEVS